MPGSEPILCFTSNKIEVHPCANCHAPMRVVSINRVRLTFEIPTFECFNCDGVEFKSSTRRLWVRVPKQGLLNEHSRRACGKSTNR
jgi:hypothetical protein